MDSQGRSPAASLLLGFLATWTLAACVLALPGCGGCRKDPAAEAEAKKKAEKEKLARPPDYEFGQKLNTRPHEVDRPQQFFKPGHWVSATLEARANKDDFRGVLHSELQDENGVPLNLDPLPYRLDTERPVVLAKGQKRFVEFSMYVPSHAPLHPRAKVRLSGAAGSFEPPFSALDAMSAHQYYFIVLARDREHYTYLASLDSIRAPSGHVSDPVREAHYLLVMPKAKEQIALPTNALEWTSIAYVLWDDRLPEDLSADQQQALVDWLHWGGQLIVSGPDTLDTLRDSFLSPYLPAESGESWPLDAEALAVLNGAPWSRGEQRFSLPQPWAGVKLLPQEGATSVLSSHGEPLLVERRVGRGRVIVSAFRLYGREFVNWPGCDGLFNACILRRPGRHFSDVFGGTPQVDWKLPEHGRYDADLVSQVRYLTRSGPADKSKRGSQDVSGPSTTYGRARRNIGSVGNPFAGPANQFGGPEEGPPLGPGVAGWTDFDATAAIARDRLREAAGILVPNATFVVWVLSAYLAVLVPLNWTVFKLLGRVEWAWAAAPIITIVFAVLVVRLAELDIGFARARTEIAVLELQPGYDRAHLTRYTALYSSLGTSYDLAFDDPKALAMPFPPRGDELRGQTRTTVRLRRHRKSAEGDENPIEQILLEDFVVSSNTTAMVHSEQMFDMGGTIDAEQIDGDRWKVANNTQHPLKGACLCLDRGTFWVGSLAPGEVRQVDLKLAGGRDSVNAQLDELPLTSKTPPSVGVNLRGLIELVRDELPFFEARLVGWSEEPLPGVTVAPSTAQSHAGNLIVAHLRHGPLPKPENCLDDNTRAQVQRKPVVEPEPESEPAKP